MGKVGLRKMSQIVPFFSDFSPVSYQFRTFFMYFSQGIFGNFPQFPIFPHFPPFFHFPYFSSPLRLRPMPDPMGPTLWQKVCKGFEQRVVEGRERSWGVLFLFTFRWHSEAPGTPY